MGPDIHLGKPTFMIEKFIKRKVTTTMIYVAIVLVGFISLNKLPVQLVPDIEFPKLTVITAYENAAPAEVEKLVTKYIEEAVTSVNGVLTIQSESMEGMSLVTAKFDWKTDMDLALIEAKEKVDLIKGQLPQDTERSIVMKVDPRDEPIMIYSIVNQKGDFKQVRRRIEKEFLPYIERIEGVALAEINGGFTRQINVDLDVAKIYSYNLSLAEVMENVYKSNFSFPAGNVEKENREYLVRTVGEFEDLHEIEQVVVGRNDNGIPIYLDNIGAVQDDYKDRKSVIRFNGNEALALLIKKEPGKNTIETCDHIKEKIGVLQQKFKNDFKITKIYDQSEFIQSAVGNVFHEGIIGGLIAIMVLWFFLKELRSPLIIAITIPISMIGTFALMYFKHISLNTISLGGLALGIGMITDSSIVVLESINNKKAEMKKGDSVVKAVVAGTTEVMTPVIASGIAQVVVFLPIVFIAGLSGAIFGELAWTISFSHIVGMFCAITLVPMLSVISIPKTVADHPMIARISGSLAAIEKKTFVLSDRVMSFFITYYNKMISYALEHERQVIIGGVSVFFLGILLFAFVEFELMPRVDPGEFTIDMEAPRGTTLKETAALSRRVESALLERSYIRSVYAKIGSDPDENIAEKTSGRGPNNILLKVILNSGRRPHIATIVETLKKEIPVGEQIRVNYVIKENVIETIFAHNVKPVHVEIYGKEMEVLKRVGFDLRERLAKVQGVVNCTTLYDRMDPELKINIDRNKIATLGLRISDIASTIKSAIHGDVVTKYREKDEEVDIRVRLREEDRNERDSLGKILIKAETGSAIPLRMVSSVDEGAGASRIIRHDQSRVNIITADIAGNRSRVYRHVVEMINSMKLPEGYECKLVNDREEVGKTLGEMRFAFLLSIVFIYMVLASQFQSFRNPLIVMLSIPVASLGVSGALLLTGKSFNINSGIGILILAGLVVNNAIVLFDFITVEIEKGRPVQEAIIEAGTKRLRPIMMTAFLSMLTVLPIAFGIGEGAELEQPMAITTIGGLLISTFLTLLFIPTVFHVVHTRFSGFVPSSNGPTAPPRR